MKLEDWLERQMIPKMKFCRRLGITWPTLAKILEGSDIKISLAYKIQDLTKNEVTIDELHNTYLRQKSLIEKAEQI